MHQQLVLPLGLDESYRFENFIPGENTFTVDYLSSLHALPMSTSVYLYGPSGSGRSHLLQAVCHQFESQSCTYIPIRLEDDPNRLLSMENYNCIALDDVDKIAGDAAWEEALFHLYNRAQINQSRLLLSSSLSPLQLNYQLQDLISRYRSALCLTLKPLTELELIELFGLRAKQKGLLLNEELIRFIFSKMPRDVRSLMNFLEKIEHATLEHQRRITIPFLKKIFYR